MDDFSNTLLSIRKKSGLTQSEFAAKIGLKQNTYSMLENGKNKPKIETIRNIIKEFDVNPNDLFSEYKSGVDESLSFLAAQLRKNRDKIINNDTMVDVRYYKRLYDSLEKKHPSLYEIKTNLDKLLSFQEAVKVVDEIMADKINAAFRKFTGAFDYKEYEKQAIEALANLKPYEKPLSEISDAITKFYTAMMAVPGNTIDFEEHIY